VSVVATCAWFLLGRLPHGHDFGGIGQHAPIDIAQRDDVGGRDLDQAKQPYQPDKMRSMRSGFSAA